MNDCKNLESIKTCSHVVLRTLDNGRVECFLFAVENATNNLFSKNETDELWKNGKHTNIPHSFTSLKTYKLLKVMHSRKVVVV